jgi:asparagine synthase (glutamine-hydrolysing)
LGKRKTHIRKKINFDNLNFQTTGDTEVILLGYELWGEKVLQKLRGMFAFAIFDFIKKEFFFARDNFGIKPFYYYLPENLPPLILPKDNMAKSSPPKLGGDSSALIFGSEIKAFLKHPYFVKEFNEKLLPSYLTFSCVPATINETFFKNVFKLPPAHFAKYSLETGEFKIEKYWQASFGIEKCSCHPAEILSETKNLLQDPGKLKLDSAIKNSSEQKEFFPQNDERVKNKIEEEKTFENYVNEIEKTFSESVSKHMIADKSVEVIALIAC